MRQAPGDEQGGYLHQIIRLRVEVVILVLLLISLVLFVVNFLGQTYRWRWVGYVPLEPLATTALSTGIIGVIWEWFIRRDSVASLRRTLVELGAAERPVLAREIAATVLTDDALLRALITTNNSDRILTAALSSITGNAELAEGIHRGVISGTISSEDYWENYRARISVRDSADRIRAGDDLDPFFDFYVELRYEMTLRKSVFRLAAAASLETLKSLQADRAFDGCWLVSPSPPYTEINDELFALQYMRIGDVDLDISSRREPDRLVYTAESARLSELIGHRVTTEYRYRMKFDKRGHIFCMNVRVPTRRVAYEFDHSQSTIIHVNMFDLLITPSPVRVRTRGDATLRAAVEVEVPDWVFPGGGVAFAWVLRGEHDTDFLRRIGRPPD